MGRPSAPPPEPPCRLSRCRRRQARRRARRRAQREARHAAVLRKSRRVTGVLTPSVAWWSLSSELIPPPYMVPSPSAPPLGVAGSRDPPDGLSFSGAASGRRARGFLEPRGAPVDISDQRLATPHDRPLYGRSLPRYGHDIVADSGVKDRCERLYPWAQGVHAGLTSSGLSFSRSAHFRATVAGWSCMERAMPTRRSTSCRLDAAGTPGERERVLHAVARVPPHGQADRRHRAGWSLATAMTCHWYRPAAPDEPGEICGSPRMPPWTPMTNETCSGSTSMLLAQQVQHHVEVARLS